MQSPLLTVTSFSIHLLAHLLNIWTIVIIICIVICKGNKYHLFRKQVHTSCFPALFLFTFTYKYVWNSHAIIPCIASYCFLMQVVSNHDVLHSLTKRTPNTQMLFFFNLSHNLQYSHILWLLLLICVDTTFMFALSNLTLTHVSLICSGNSVRLSFAFHRVPGLHTHTQKKNFWQLMLDQ